MKNLRIISICCTVLSGLLGTAFAANVINVANFGDGTPSLANVQAAYNAASNGDTIMFPANGSATWNAALTLSKAVTFTGNGTTLTVSQPLIFGLFRIRSITNSTDLLRITGFTMNLVNNNGGGHAITAALQSTDVRVANLRIDNNTFKHGTLQLEIGGCYGVIDHNKFMNSLSAIETTAGSVGQAAESWASLTAGAADCIFVEDNEFIDNSEYIGNITQPKIDGYNGGKLVVRYNKFDFTGCPPVESGNTTAATIGLHGSAAGGTPFGYWQLGTGARRAHSVIEVYHNTMTGRRIDFMYTARGSANLVWNNTLTTPSGVSNQRILMREEEGIDGVSMGWQWDPIRTAWPAEDQVHNSFYWGNVFNGRPQAASNVDVFPDTSTTFIQLNRDYFLHEPQSTGGSESFTGEGGASNTFPTNGGTNADHLGNTRVYPTRGTMIFTPTGPNAFYPYVPYTYPHPLTTSTTTTFPPSDAKVQIQVTP